MVRYTKRQNEMQKPKPALTVAFYKESNGNEPVRKWLKSLDEEEEDE